MKNAQKHRGVFVKVKCPDCQHEQIIFNKPSTTVVCLVCNATIAKPTGGKAKIRGSVSTVYLPQEV